MELPKYSRIILPKKIREAFWAIAAVMLIGWTQAAWAQTKITGSDRDANSPSSPNFSNYYPNSSEKLISDLGKLLGLRTGKILKSDVDRVFQVQLKDDLLAPKDNTAATLYASVPGVDWYFTLGGAEYKNGNTEFYFSPARKFLGDPEICLPEERIIESLTVNDWRLAETFPSIHGEFSPAYSYRLEGNGTTGVRFTGPLGGRPSCLLFLTISWKNSLKN